MSYTFDGPNKRIILNSGVTTLVLADVWSRWKEWVLAGNAQFLQALDTVGGDIAAIPLYLFPKNGWKIVPQAADHTLTVTGGVLATDDASDPFVDPAGSHAIRIVREAPGIAIGYASDGSTGPTAGDIASAVLSAAVEGIYTMSDILKILAAVAAGKTNITDLGGGNAHVEFDHIDESGVCVEAEMTGSERTDVTLTP